MSPCSIESASDIWAAEWWQRSANSHGLGKFLEWFCGQRATRISIEELKIKRIIPPLSMSLMTFPGRWCFAISLSSTPLIENYAWPLHTRENPVYYIFNAEGHDNPKVPKFGRGPMATSCAFWNDFLPRVRAWSGECLAYTIFDLGSSICSAWNECIEMVNQKRT